jgi:hypothetical protein
MLRVSAFVSESLQLMFGRDTTDGSETDYLWTGIQRGTL